uniref:Cytochrome b561 domain-containing protein n=1 Tax=Parastrongyloides trichosuri TaxID=131310 RepID=A0A0N4ZC56_PARTI
MHPQIKDFFSITFILSELFILSKCQSSFFNTSECGTTKGCLFSPANCNPNTNCVYFFSYYEQNNRLIMEIGGNVTSTNNAYIAVGFSSDTSMGNDAVTECSSFNGAPFAGRLSYNPGKSNRVVDVSLDANNVNMLQTIQASLVNGILYCKLSQSLTPPASFANSNEILQNNIQNYFIFLVSGTTNGNNLRIHSLDSSSQLFPYTSPQSVDIKRYKRDVNGVVTTDTTLNSGNTTSNSVALNDEAAANLKFKRTLVQIHGILMIIAWSVFLTTGILAARYLKGNWPNTKLCGILIWFHLHRTLNIIGIGATIASFAIIFVSKDWTWKGPSIYKTKEENESWGSIHSILGLLACCIAWAQPIGAVFRCSPDSSFRIIFRIIHGFFGILSWLGALAATMIAIVHFKSLYTNSTAALALYITFIAVLGIVIIVNEFLSIRLWLFSRRAVHSSEIEMVQVKNGKTYVERSDDVKKFYNLRYPVFILFLVVSIGTTVAICTIIGLS